MAGNEVQIEILGLPKHFCEETGRLEAVQEIL
jgi:hypothetical protein